MARLEVADVGEAVIFLVLGGTGERCGLEDVLAAVGIDEGVDADDRVLPGVLEALVVKRLLLDLRALVSGFHGAQHPASLGQMVELLQHALLHPVREPLHE